MDMLSAVRLGTSGPNQPQSTHPYLTPHRAHAPTPSHLSRPIPNQTCTSPLGPAASHPSPQTRPLDHLSLAAASLGLHPRSPLPLPRGPVRHSDRLSALPPLRHSVSLLLAAAALAPAARPLSTHQRPPRTPADLHHPSPPPPTPPFRLHPDRRPLPTPAEIPADDNHIDDDYDCQRRHRPPLARLGVSCCSSSPDHLLPPCPRKLRRSSPATCLGPSPSLAPRPHQTFFHLSSSISLDTRPHPV
ncbi:hypothetical protein EDB80DRAFT_301058 [Ilyonectria destructans]|nr:hypothetical protein EDB80DRAFT_301058 [Ilyonectria destructans]